MSSFGGVTFTALEDGFSEKRLSTTVRQIACDVLLTSAGDWDALSAQTTDLSLERIPGGDFILDITAGGLSSSLVLDLRGTFTGYLTSAELSYFHSASTTHRAKCEWTTTG
jgi:hypothetical protein